jgi:hypothetical protein
MRKIHQRELMKKLTQFFLEHSYPEIEVTEIIAIVLRQLSSHSRGFLSKMVLKVVFDKTAFVKFKISNTFKKNTDVTHSKQPRICRKIHTSLWICKSEEKICELKVLRLLSNVCDFQKKPYPRVWI